MKSINKLILISILVKLFIAEEPPTIYDELECGKKDPTKPKDCTKYGTGSGMVCCWISDSNKKNGKCRLVPDQTARDQGISGTKEFDDAATNIKYWDCGNKANYIYVNLAIVLLFLFLL